MRILIVSDTHGRNTNYKKVLDLVKPVDTVIHLGDIDGYERDFAKMAGCRFYAVQGNNDYCTELPREQIETLGKYKAFLSHGHGYRVSMGTEVLSERAASLGCDIAMYGHTHVPVVKKENGVTVLNPGSLSLPRQANGQPSYIMMDIDRFGEAHYNICYMEKLGFWR